ncbi:hypothetical protein KR222_007444 [Zaprionus bogoriensis]|nr:hypothetical protein KR222_007444 [Zaprionus bogoriensis]
MGNFWWRFCEFPKPRNASRSSQSFDRLHCFIYRVSEGFVIYTILVRGGRGRCMCIGQPQKVRMNFKSSPLGKHRKQRGDPLPNAVSHVQIQFISQLRRALRKRKKKLLKQKKS